MGLRATNSYWPLNTLVSLNDASIYDENLVECSGMYVIQGWDIDETSYDTLIKGNESLVRIRGYTFRALLQSPIDTLSSWSADFDPPGDLYRSLAVYVQAHLSSFPHTWTLYYKS